MYGSLSNLFSHHLLFVSVPVSILVSVFTISPLHGNLSNDLPLCECLYGLLPNTKKSFGLFNIIRRKLKIGFGKNMYPSGGKRFIFNLTILNFRLNNTSLNLHYLKSLAIGKPMLYMIKKKKSLGTVLSVPCPHFSVVTIGV